MSEPSDLLNREELLVLAAGVREMMKADGTVSEGEIEVAGDLARRLGLGEDIWESIWSEAMRKHPNVDAMMTAAGNIERTEARELVYELLYEVATDGSIVDTEWDLLEWLDETWRFEDSKKKVATDQASALSACQRSRVSRAPFVAGSMSSA